ncbi:MAG: biotin/lipoate A/B protein ligase family protein [Thermoplasmata archaeon]
MEWRFVPKKKYDPAVAIASEEILLKKVSRTKTPVVRFWEWKSKAATIGRSQKVSNELDLEFCESKNVSVIRRPTGGGAMYHAPKDELVYSIVAPRDHFPDDITQIYRDICKKVVKSLDRIDIESRFVEPNSIFIDENKVSGSAQKITKDVILQHGTLLYDPDRDMMFSLLKRNEPPERHIGSNVTSVTGITEFSDVSLSHLYRTLKEGILNNKKYFTKDLTKKELENAEKLADKKYKKEGWNLSP